MAIVNKESHLKDIAAIVRKGFVLFEEGDRPGLKMGGRDVFIRSLEYSHDTGDICYSVCNKDGEILPSSKGERSVKDLPPKILSEVHKSAGKYLDAMLERLSNEYRLGARAKAASEERSSNESLGRKAFKVANDVSRKFVLGMVTRGAIKL